jgi:hypothetical protein
MSRKEGLERPHDDVHHVRETNVLVLDEARASRVFVKMFAK